MNQRHHTPLPEALQLHRETTVIDLHADTLMQARMVKYDLAARHRNPIPGSPGFFHCDLPRWREGGVDGQVLGLVTSPYPEFGSLAAALRQTSILRQTAERHPDKIMPCRNGRDLRKARENNQLAAFLGVEGAHILEGDPGNTAILAANGVISIGLAHFTRNSACPPAAGIGASRTRGLSDVGRDIISECNESGLLIDLAHVGRAAFFEACALSELPPFVSHTGVSGAKAHWRNIDDDQLKAIAEGDGVVGIIFSRRYLAGPDADLRDLVRHMNHVRTVIGPKHVALGSDYDGMITPVRGLEDVSHLPRLTQALLDENWPHDDIRDALGHNFLRILDLLPSATNFRP